MISFKVFVIKLLNLILIILYTVFVVLISSEIIVRNSYNWIPENLIEYLSPGAQSKVIKERGQIQDDDTPIYHYQPFQKLNYYPHIKIDENGFRNSVFNQKEVDTILLGDSLIFARDSKNDLGDLFRSKGISSLNLSIGGYSPQHYRDTYKKYVFEKDIKHKNVIINIFVGNDFSDASRYPWKLEPTKSKGNKYFPWIINLIIGSVEIYGKSKYYYMDIVESIHRITLPYKEIGIRYLWWTPKPSEEEWNKTESAIKEIVRMAGKANSKVTIVIIPSPASVYGLKLHKDFSPHVESHEKIVNRLRKTFNQINIIDINDRLAEEIEKKFLYSGESDAHFNSYGTEFFFNIIKSELNIDG